MGNHEINHPKCDAQNPKPKFQYDLRGYKYHIPSTYNKLIMIYSPTWVLHCLRSKIIDYALEAIISWSSVTHSYKAIVHIRWIYISILGSPYSRGRNFLYKNLTELYFFKW